MASSKAEDYRREAKECLRMAASTPNPQIKANWLEMAEQWLLLATRREERSAEMAEPAPKRDRA